MTTRTTAKKVWAVLLELNPAEDAGRIAALAYDLADELPKQIAARQEADGVNRAEEDAGTALLALLRATGTIPGPGLVVRACELAEAMAKEHQRRFPFLSS